MKNSDAKRESATNGADCQTLQFDLPPFPSAASRIVNELNRGAEANVRVVAQLIQCEPAIASRVIRLANSPIYGVGRPVTTVQHATVVLGFKAVSQLALSVAVGDLFRADDPLTSKALEQIYVDSLAVSVAGRLLALGQGNKQAEEVFLAGVMHDIGKVVLLNTQQDTYRSACLAGADEQLDQERELFGTTHPEVGAQCARHWGVPETIAQAIAESHYEISAAQGTLSAYVIGGQACAKAWSQTSSSESLSDDLEATLSTHFANCCAERLQADFAEQFEAILDICLSRGTNA